MTDQHKHSVVVESLSGDDTGPWKLLVNGVGVATWPCTHESKGYALEVARVLRFALASDKSQTETVTEAFAKLSGADRIDIIRQYCLGCGTNDPRCQCDNDE